LVLLQLLVLQHLLLLQQHRVSRSAQRLRQSLQAVLLSPLAALPLLLLQVLSLLRVVLHSELLLLRQRPLRPPRLVSAALHRQQQLLRRPPAPFPSVEPPPLLPPLLPLQVGCPSEQRLRPAQQAPPLVSAVSVRQLPQPRPLLRQRVA
jgi:hypothetical protein